MTFSGYSTGSESQIYSNYQQSSLLEAEMLCLMLERMELSKGMSTIEIKTNKPHTAKITLLPSNFVIQNLTSAKNLVSGSVGQDAISSVLQSDHKPINPNKDIYGDLKEESPYAAVVASPSLSAK